MKFLTLFIASACGLSVLSAFAHASEQAFVSRVRGSSSEEGKRELSSKGGSGMAMGGSGMGGHSKGGSKKGGSNKGGSNKGGSSKGGSSKGGSGNKGGSKGGSGNKGGSKGGGKLSPVSSPISPPFDSPTGGSGSFCDTCGQTSFANIQLEGNSFFSQVIPASTGQKAGSTVAIYEEGLQGTADYYLGYGSGKYASSDITATVTGTCTILTTNVTGNIPFAIDRCFLHCTVCVTYSGEYCGDTECCPVLGFATLTGDVILDVQLNKNGEIADTFQQFTDFFGVAAITGGAYDLAGYENGALGFVEFLGDFNDPSYSLKLGVPFDEESTCKFTNDAIKQISGYGNLYLGCNKRVLRKTCWSIVICASSVFSANSH